MIWAHVTCDRNVIFLETFRYRSTENAKMFFDLRPMDKIDMPYLFLNFRHDPTKFAALQPFHSPVHLPATRLVEMLEHIVIIDMQKELIYSTRNFNMK